VLASIRTARNLGRVCRVAAAALGTVVAAVLTGFGLWAPILSRPSVIGCLVVAVSIAWGSAMLLPAPSSGAVWFGVPLAIGLAAAAITGQWGGFGAALACLLIPVLSLAFYRSDARKQS
jgi:Zn-dependent protease